MNATKKFNPNEHRSQCQAYLSHFLERPVHLVWAEPLTQSTREAPWRLDVEVDGAPRSYVLRLDSRGIEHEYHVLRAMESIPVPTPRAYGWDPEGKALGLPCFFSDFIAGESLLQPLLAGEPWAEQVYIDTACALQRITREELGPAAHRLSQEEAAEDFLEAAQAHFAKTPHPLAETVYRRLKETMPTLPETRFSNGDLWLDNMIVRDQRLAGVIDFANAGFSDPIYEFLLPFFVSPELSGRGIEARYCQHMGYDPDVLPWYHGLEYFDTWHWVSQTGEPFVHHTEASLQADLERWLQTPIPTKKGG